MANVERLTKRVKKIEEWMAENEEMGGPKGYLDTMVIMYQNARDSAIRESQIGHNFEKMRSMLFEFLSEHELVDEWDAFVSEKQDAVQEQQTEEVSVQEQAKGGKETSEAPEEEKE